MALFTTDVTLTGDEGWVAVILTGTVIHISNIHNADINVRFGISSTSGGFFITKGSTLKATETFYMRAIMGGNNDFSIVTIVKD